jgi:translation initiation factor IF-1
MDGNEEDTVRILTAYLEVISIIKKIKMARLWILPGDSLLAGFDIRIKDAHDIS